MVNTYHQIYIQAIFAVKYRAAVITVDWQSSLFAAIGQLINDTGCKAILVNGVDDHVHCLFGLKPSVTISDVMRVTKAKSSKWINDHRLTDDRFEWQDGYGAFSYSQSHVGSVYQYIANQAQHHQQETFHEEFLKFLEKFEVPYDERYLFRPLM